MREFVDIHETDLAMKLLANGKGRVRVDHEGARVQVDGASLSSALLGDVVRSRINANFARHGFGPKDRIRLDGTEPLAIPEPVIPFEETHQVAECPECSQGKHRNCDGSAWCLTHDALELCPCAQSDHQ